MAFIVISQEGKGGVPMHDLCTEYVAIPGLHFLKATRHEYNMREGMAALPYLYFLSLEITAVLGRFCACTDGRFHSAAGNGRIPVPDCGRCTVKDDSKQTSKAAVSGRSATADCRARYDTSVVRCCA
jgi:hypothetical protein